VHPESSIPEAKRYSLRPAQTNAVYTSPTNRVGSAGSSSSRACHRDCKGACVSAFVCLHTLMFTLLSRCIIITIRQEFSKAIEIYEGAISSKFLNSNILTSLENYREVSTGRKQRSTRNKGDEEYSRFA
jgi:hypothetical protein